MIREGGKTPASRVNFAFESVLGRKPTAAEGKILLAGLKRWTTRFHSDDKAALTLVAEGSYPNDPNLSSAEIAAYMMTASTILNLDETVTKE